MSTLGTGTLGSGTLGNPSGTSSVDINASDSVALTDVRTTVGAFGVADVVALSDLTPTVTSQSSMTGSDSAIISDVTNALQLSSGVSDTQTLIDANGGLRLSGISDAQILTDANGGLRLSGLLDTMALADHGSRRSS
jgi:hypothetical protein